MTQDIEELPFDLRSYKAIEYSTHFAKIKSLEEKIKSILTGIKNHTVSFGNPVSDWLPSDNESKSAGNLGSEIKISEEEKKTEAGILYPPEDKGFLDYLADTEDSMAVLKCIVEEFSAKQKELTEKINPKIKEINEAWRKPSSGTASYVRKIARKIAADMNDYGLSMADMNKKPSCPIGHP